MKNARTGNFVVYSSVSYHGALRSRDAAQEDSPGPKPWVAVELSKP